MIASIEKPAWKHCGFKDSEVFSVVAVWKTPDTCCYKSHVYCLSVTYRSNGWGSQVEKNRWGEGAGKKGNVNDAKNLSDLQIRLEDEKHSLSFMAHIASPFNKDSITGTYNFVGDVRAGIYSSSLSRGFINSTGQAEIWNNLQNMST